MKNKAVLTITGIWGLLVALQTGGVLDILPFENEKINEWIKFIVSLSVIVLNYYNQPAKKECSGCTK